MSLFGRNTPEPQISDERLAQLIEKNRKAAREDDDRREVAAQRERDDELAELNRMQSR